MTDPKRKDRSRPLLEGVGAGLGLAAADMLATGLHRTPPRMLVLIAGFGLACGLAAGVAGTLVRRRGVPLGFVVALAAGVNGIAFVSERIQGDGRLPSALVVAGCALAAGLACLGGRPRSLGAAFMLVASAPAASLLLWALNAGDVVPVVLASSLPLGLALALRIRTAPAGHLTSAVLLVGTALILAAPTSTRDRELARPDVDLARGPAPGVDSADVVLIVVDTLRDDMVETERGDGLFARLARDGVRFQECVSAAPWTLPAVASILTALLPSQHGATSAGRPLPSDLETLAEVFSANGYSTAAFTGGAFVSPAFRLDQGFEHFDATAELGFRPFQIHVPLAWRLAKNRYAAQRSIVRWIGEYPGITGLRHATEEWFAQRDRSRPAFVLVHTYEAHDYYLYHPTVDDEFVAGRPDRVPPRRFGGRLTVHPGEFEDASQPELDWFRALYAARIEHVERELDGLLANLRLESDRPRVVAVVSDHGEGFDVARGRVHHGGRLHDDLLLVPFLVHAPDRLPAGRVVSEQVRTIDVMPTLLDLAGVPVPASITGVSATGLARGSESGPMEAWSEELAHGLELLALRTKEWKLVRSPTAQRAFDLRTDAMEDRGDAQAPADLLDSLRTFETRFPRREVDDAEIDAATRGHLRNLGYVE